jgi:hypothetical protein
MKKGLKLLYSSWHFLEGIQKVEVLYCWRRASTQDHGLMKEWG